MEAMSKSSSRRFPVTFTHLPVTRCQICRRTVAYRPGSLSQVLTEHYRRAIPKRSACRPGNLPRRPGTNLAVSAGAIRQRPGAAAGRLAGWLYERISGANVVCQLDRPCSRDAAGRELVMRKEPSGMQWPWLDPALANNLEENDERKS
jgi:hypothetical protein